MSFETVFLYTLNRTGEDEISGMKSQCAPGPLRSELDRFLNYFWSSKESDRAAAISFFSGEWERIYGGAAPTEIPRQVDFEGYVEESRALKRECSDAEDFDFKLDNTQEVVDFLRGGPQQTGAETTGKSRFSFDQELWLCEQGRAVKGRILACLCERGRKWSVTVRRTQVKTGKEFQHESEPASRPDPDYLNSTETVSNVLGRIVFGTKTSKQSGLIVISGRTGTSKSKIAIALVKKLLGDDADKRLLTYEDPIERHISTAGSYISREKGKDVKDLEEATHNALRQKPAVMFVGETRNPEEWEELLNFAGTGHLVVTTSHAGSLIESIGNILQAARAVTPSDRSNKGGRLLAVVHLKAETIRAAEGDNEITILIPALWHYTPEGVKELMSEGLSSIAPNTPHGLSGSGRDELFPSSIGRYWFAKELLKDVIPGTAEKMSEKDKQNIKVTALEWDLEGV